MRIRVFITLVLLLIPIPVYAPRFITGGEVRIAADQVIDDNLVVIAEIVKVDGSINGDLTVLGRNVQIDGLVKGDVVVTAGSFSLNGDAEGGVFVLAVNSAINGKVSRNVRLLGNFIESDGEIKGSLSVIGNIVILDENNRIGKDVLVVGRKADISGEINRDLSGIAWQTKIWATVGRDVELEVRRLELMPQASINGGIRYVSGRKISIDEEKVVKGEVKYLPLNQGRMWNWINAYYNRLKNLSVSPILKTGALVSMLLVGSIFILFSPVNVLAMSDQIWRNPFGSLLMGLAFLIITPIIVLFLFILVVGIPAGIILMYIYSIALYASRVFVSLAVGRGILKLLRVRIGISRRRQVLALLIGLVVLNASTYIPYIGLWLATVYVVLGLGALALEINFGKRGMI